MPLITARESSHYYLKDGTPFYEVPNKSKGGMRPATIADARKAGACPSVTTILSILRKPSLENWKVEQALLSALTLPVQPGEKTDDFVKRIVQDMEAQSEKARELGSQVHEACAARANAANLGFGIWVNTQPLAEPFCQWFNAHVTKVHAVEEVFVGDGYAGRCDLVADVDGQTSILDLKTQTVKNGKPNFYLDWPVQLCAYRRAAGYSKNDARLISVVIDVGNSGTVTTKEWTEGTWDDDEYFKVFSAAFILWKHMNSWD